MSVTIVENGKLVNLTVEQFNARETARLAALNLPLDSDGDWEGVTDESVATVYLVGRAYTDYNGDSHAESDLITLKGIGYEGLQTARVKTYKTSPSRSNNGSLSDINQIRTFVVPRCKITFALMSVSDYYTLMGLFEEYQEFYAEYFDKTKKSRMLYLMYAEAEELTKFYNIDTKVIGTRDYSISLTATLNELNYANDGVNSTAAEALGYSLSTDETYYSVTSIGDVTSTDVVIPSTYDGLPVTGIIATSGTTGLTTGAFQANTTITVVSIPESVTSIDLNSFYGCTSLKLVTIPPSVTSVGASAFYKCTSLVSVTIPDSVTSIGTYAFGNCTSLVSATLPDSGASIPNSLFYGCTSLPSITIPSSVTRIGKYAFDGCTSLTRVYFEDPDDWFYASSSSATSGTSVDLSNPETAASLLTASSTSQYFFIKAS